MNVQNHRNSFLGHFISGPEFKLWTSQVGTWMELNYRTDGLTEVVEQFAQLKAYLVYHDVRSPNLFLRA